MHVQAKPHQGEVLSEKVNEKGVSRLRGVVVCFVVSVISVRLSAAFYYEG